jgi:hypothetical protein
MRIGERVSHMFARRVCARCRTPTATTATTIAIADDKGLARSQTHTRRVCQPFLVGCGARCANAPVGNTRPPSAISAICGHRNRERSHNSTPRKRRQGMIAVVRGVAAEGGGRYHVVGQALELLLWSPRVSMCVTPFQGAPAAPRAHFTKFASTGKFRFVAWEKANLETSFLVM